MNPDLLEEVDLTLELLKHLARPEAPGLEVKGPHEIEVTWLVVELKSGSPVTYTLFCGESLFQHLAMRIMCDIIFSRIRKFL